VTDKKPRRLIIESYAGHMITANDLGYPLHHYQIYLTGIVNANTAVPITAAVQEQCSLGCWHTVSHSDLLPWGSD
jgi:hypothetical protein